MFVGTPAVPDLYEQHETEGLTVYVPKDGIYEEAGVKIDLVREKGNLRLKVAGLKTIPRERAPYEVIHTSKARRILE